MTSKIIYEGELRTKAEHLRSGNNIITDAPIDNNGKGEYFSPTDLLATALGSCMLTIIGIYSKKNNINIKGSIAEVTKIMGEEPRCVKTIKVILDFTKINISEKTQKIFKKLAVNCPVALSLDKNIVQEVSLKFN
jgi:uncharacterized OsmC-like protein